MPRTAAAPAVPSATDSIAASATDEMPAGPQRAEASGVDVARLQQQQQQHQHQHQHQHQQELRLVQAVELMSAGAPPAMAKDRVLAVTAEEHAEELKLLHALAMAEQRIWARQHKVEPGQHPAGERPAPWAVRPHC